MMKIDHVALFCQDLEAMRDFFITYFEATSNDLYHNQRTGLRTYILSFPNGDTRLELMQRPDVTRQAVPEHAHLGYIHLSLAVGSRMQVEALTSRLQAEGYHVLSGPRTTGDGYYESCVEGPEKILIEITV